MVEVGLELEREEGGDMREEVPKGRGSWYEGTEQGRDLIR